MSQNPTRRDFLQSVGCAAGGVLSAKFASTLPRGLATAPAAGDIAVRVTAGAMRYASTPPLAWREGTPAGANVITLDSARKFQDVLGFGAAFTEAACITFQQLPAAARDQLLHEFFHPSEMGLNACRTCIGASDYSTEVFSYDEGDPDPEMKRFSIAHDETSVLPVLRLARKENPELFLFSSPWSPPGWMKAGGSMLGGSMRQRYFGAYAQYLLKFLQAYAVNGVPIQALTVQNEVDTDQDARMPACLWGQEYEIGFVKNHLGPLLEKNGVSTKIWILDHNYNLWGRAICELDDPGLRKYCDDVAFHGYVGSPDMMSKVHDAHPDARLYWTEGGPDYDAPDYQTDWAKWAATFTGAMRNWCRSITGWNLALDEKGRPDIGPFHCGGVVTVHSQTKEITRSGQFWALAHFSRAVRRGARRFESQGTLPDVEHIAFENPDGQKVVVLSNSGPAKTAALQHAGHTADLPLAADSVTTLAWN